MIEVPFDGFELIRKILEDRIRVFLFANLLDSEGQEDAYRPDRDP